MSEGSRGPQPADWPVPNAANRVMIEELRRLETQVFPASATTSNGSGGVPSVWTLWVRRSYRVTRFSVRWLVQIPLGVMAIPCGSAPTGERDETSGSECLHTSTTPQRRQTIHPGLDSRLGASD